MIPLSDPRRERTLLAEALDQAALAVIQSGTWLFGPVTERFAQDFAAYIGVTQGIPCANGTDALELALRALGVGAGDEVITASNAGGYTTTACRVIGAIPVYAEIRWPDLTLDPQAAAALLSPRVRAVVITHLYGNCGAVAELRQALDAAGGQDVPIIEDCAQAHAARAEDGRMAGSLGTIATFSFYPSKNLGALGDAGMVVTRDPTLAARLKRLQQYGWAGRYDSQEPFGRNSRMDEIQAAFLAVKLPHLDAWTAARQAILARYRAALPEGYDLAALPGERSAGHLAVLLTPDRAAAARHFAAAGIATGIHYPVLDQDQRSQDSLPFRADGQSLSRRARDRILSIPCFSLMTEQEVATVVQALETLPLPEAAAA